MYMRRKCQECRLKKCLAVGMRPECKLLGIRIYAIHGNGDLFNVFFIAVGVVPEYQCAVKREAKKAQKEKDKPNSTTQSPTPKEGEIKEERISLISGNTERSTSKLRPTGRSLSVEQEELINRLVYFQDEFEQPTEDDLKRSSVRLLMFQCPLWVFSF